MANEQTHHAEPSDSNTRWEDKNGSTDPLPITENGEGESKDSRENVRWSAQELRIARRVTHSLHENNGEEVSECVTCGGRTAEKDSEAPVVDVAEVNPELFGGEGVVLGVGTISFDTIECPFSLLLGEECIFVRKILDNYNRGSEWRGRMERNRRTEEGNDTGGNRADSKEDEYPLPAIQTTLASELCDTASNGRGEATDLYVLLVQLVQCSKGRQSATYEDSQDIETCQSFLDFRSQVPCTNDIGTWYIISAKPV